MVLSNKKLKQKIRTQLAESLAASESHINQPNSKPPQTPQSFKSLLNSLTQKPKLSKREKRRVKIPSFQESSNLENQSENGVGKKETEVGSGGLKKNKKRKREKDVGIEENEVKDLSEKKSGKKKKTKKNKRKKKVKEEEGVKKENGGSEEQAVAEAIQTHSCKEVGVSTKIYVGGIPYYSTPDDIRSFFEGCGSITEIDCLKFPETGKFNGIAMISFRTEAAAKRALALDGSDMGGLSLKIQPYKATREKKVSDFAPAVLEGYNRIYVGNLSWDITEDELKKLFSDCTLSSIRLGKNKETGEFRGFAHVDFANSLSLTMALKLDQKPLLGRPVRIRCAVPPKSATPGSKSESVVRKKDSDLAKTNDFRSEKPVGDTGVNDDTKDSMGIKINRCTCYECGERGHVSSSCPKKQADDVANDDMAVDKADTFTSVVAEAKEEADNTMVNSVSDGKVRRRTCYECGEKGHLSSSCPKKQAADMANSGKEDNDVAFGKAKEEADNNMVNSVSDGKMGKKCFGCGEKGHISSSCLEKHAADVARSGKKANNVALEDKEEVDNSMVNSVSDGKLRRRTCYECGEKGHLSSSCPKIQAADVAGSGKEVEKAENFTSVVAVGKEADNDVVNSVGGGKIRRRTCYECGQKGHLSSSCPKIKEAGI